MSTKYVIDLSGFPIRAHECVKETAKFVWLKGVFYSDTITRRKKGLEAFDTWAEAHAELMRCAEAKLADARRTLLLAQNFAGNVRGLKPPEEVEP